MESDISGVAADESDLSNLSLSIGDLPLTAGVRVYGHSPNKNLNATLNIIALVALFLGLGLGLGHFIGKCSRIAFSWSLLNLFSPFH